MVAGTDPGHGTYSELCLVLEAEPPASILPKRYARSKEDKEVVDRGPLGPGECSQRPSDQVLHADIQQRSLAIDQRRSTVEETPM